MKQYRQSAIRNRLELRARIIQAIRKHFIAQGYLEVETPVRIPAPVPEAYIDPEVSGTWFLQTSPELCMKRLLSAGFNNIFQICKCFRNQERGRKHLPELTMLEWYGTGLSYLDSMDQCEQLIMSIRKELNCGESLDYQGMKIDLKTPWRRLSVARAFDAYASMTMNDAVLNNCFDEIMVEEIEPRMGIHPIFLYDYPASRGALAKLKAEDAAVAERFEMYIGGLELCNGFSELTQPLEQRLRFEKEQNLREASGKPVYPLPEKFLNVLANMPDSAGNALGIDRLIMLFGDTKSIDDVVTFTPEEL